MLFRSLSGSGYVDRLYLPMGSHSHGSNACFPCFKTSVTKYHYQSPSISQPYVLDHLQSRRHIQRYPGFIRDISKLDPSYFERFLDCSTEEELDYREHSMLAITTNFGNPLRYNAPKFGLPPVLPPSPKSQIPRARWKSQTFGVPGSLRITFS